MGHREKNSGQTVKAFLLASIESVRFTLLCKGDKEPLLNINISKFMVIFPTIPIILAH